MRRIWLPDGKPGIEYHGEVFCLDDKTRQLRPTGRIGLRQRATRHCDYCAVLPLKLRHTMFQIDQVAQEGM